MTVAENNAGATAAAAEAVVPALSRGERFTSYDVAAFEVPSGREENWRFTPLKRLRGLHDGSAAATGEVKVDADVAAEVKVETVARDDARLGEAGVPSDRIAAQAYSSFESATVVTVPRETKASKPSVVRITGPGEGLTAYGHVQVRAEQFAEAAIVLDHVGSGTYADNVEFVLGDGAQLTVVSVQDWADDAVHVSEQHLRLGRDAKLKHIVVTLGGDAVRVSPTATFAEPGGDVEMLGLYFADAGQHQEHRLFVDHAVPHCSSDVLYKGALQGKDAHAVWIGDVLIRAAAEGTETFELNRNLVLTEGARADSVPNLEIETGEIAKAGHASTTGRFDDEQLFYLQSRGIPEEEARRLVVRGFFHEVLMKIDLPEVRERLEAAIEDELRAIGI
ncbi:Fe-S cluster assembly protein SufD [Saccharomonospora azurea]|uniref:Fe-S cluster assembly protein SufD n=1 Tax=Saccharomonospora azurea TaxID=40988 RepID=UPI00055B40FA|nr:Fe-S cluster assembly protein SufD [Saccharomonospora azurea]